MDLDLNRGENKPKANPEKSACSAPADRFDVTQEEPWTTRESKRFFENQGHGAQVQLPALQRIVRGVDQYSGIIFPLFNEDVNCSRKTNQMTTQLENCMYYAQPTAEGTRARMNYELRRGEERLAAAGGQQSTVRKGDARSRTHGQGKQAGVEFYDEEIVERKAECGTSQLPSMR
ncbi:hypothetical protein B0H13DRAFT_1903627 [Mycena leptocephala]|nr:hypothetical protein B0H13DRAFT_1903627 [Mycena leptocephala]